MAKEVRTIGKLLFIEDLPEGGIIRVFWKMLRLRQERKLNITEVIILNEVLNEPPFANEYQDCEHSQVFGFQGQIQGMKRVWLAFEEQGSQDLVGSLL